MSTPDSIELWVALSIFPNTFLIKWEHSAPFSRAVCLGKFLVSHGQVFSCFSLSKFGEISPGFGICKEIFLWKADSCSHKGCSDWLLWVKDVLQQFREGLLLGLARKMW